MKTEDLIRGLSADAANSGRPLGKIWLLALAPAILAAAAVMLSTLGPRADFAEAASTVRFLFKFVLTIALAIAAFGAVRALSRPEGGQSVLAFFLIPLALAIAAVVLELLAAPSDQWATRLIGRNAYLCMAFIPLIGAAPLAIFLAVLRHGAASRPALAGAIAGVLAGAVSATFYAAHCFDDSPLFVATWYTLAIAIMAAVGAFSGRVVARW